MILTMGEALERMSQRVYENKKSIKQDDVQRRNEFVDVYGTEFYRNGDANAPARFYISVSKDMIYYLRFQFKLIISPFISTTSGGTSPVTVSVNDTSLSVSGSTITPNPHKHTTNAHTHNLISGITQTPVTASDFKVSVEGIDITPYLAAQQGGWISGEGVWPSLDLDKNYDILEVISNMRAEGRTAEAELIERVGYKPVEISASAPFACTLSLYLKYSHPCR